MKLFQTKPDDIQDPSDKLCPGYRNVNTAWWVSERIADIHVTSTY